MSDQQEDEGRDWLKMEGIVGNTDALPAPAQEPLRSARRPNLWWLILTVVVVVAVAVLVWMLAS